MASSAAQKLGIRPDSTSFVIGMSTSGVTSLLGELPEGAQLVDRAEAADLVLLFAGTIDDVSNGGRAAYDHMAPTGRCWIAYRKGANRGIQQGSGTSLHRDTLQAALAGLGLDGVTLIAIDDTWSAMRIKSVH